MLIFKSIAMKNSTKAGTKNLRWCFIGHLLLFSIILASCSKNIEATPYAYLSIANTSPTLGTYNIYLDGTKTNTSGAVAFGGVLAYGTVTAGDHTLKLTTESGTDALLSKTVSLEADGAYSAFLVDKAENMDVLLVKDEMTVVSTEKAFIRFINLSPDAPALDLSVANGETLISSKAYKSASAFQAIDPKNYAFDIKDHTTGLIKGGLPDQAFTAGKYYTIISRGMMVAGNIDQPFGAQLIINL
jgi:hypothetical protein